VAAARRYGAYYVWADEPVEQAGDEPIFPGEEDGVWAFDEEAGAYYHHQFYGFQPDLNLANDDVFDEIVRLATLWLRRGVDGFRIDAAMPAVLAKPTEGTGADPGRFYERLRSRLAAVRSDVVLIGEADVPPERISVLTDHRRLDGVLDFALNNAMFLALAREDPRALHEALSRLDRSVPASARLNFVRNVDELDLEQLSGDERKQVFDAFGDVPGAFLYGRGLRRGWAPMMRERFRMTLSLLFALPGVPLVMYGQELGIGDDLGVEGRDACRPVMQWTAEGGFSSAPESALILPAQRRGPFDFAHVNAVDQRSDPGSPLTLTQCLARLRGETRLASEPVRAVPVPGAPAVLALEGERALTLHNLAGHPQRVELPGAEVAEPLLAEGWRGATLAPYGFAWLRRRRHGSCAKLRRDRADAPADARDSADPPGAEVDSA
jgi:maltose alpha-D-glucosyltransferase/alpha-amylase